MRHARLAKGLTQGELSEVSGVHRDSIQKLETGQRPARPSTIKKLSDALGVETDELVNEGKEKTMELSAEQKRVEVEIRWDTGYGPRAEILRFRGEEIDGYLEGETYCALYECPGGYRVYVDNGDGTMYLNPSRPGYTGEFEYPTYTVEELVEEFPAFGETVGVYRVRDID